MKLVRLTLYLALALCLALAWWACDRLAGPGPGARD